MAKRVRQFGTWPSSISPKALAVNLRLNDVQWDTSGETLVWHETRGGQGMLVAQTGLQAPRDLTPEFSVRARVGYGGGDFTVAGGTVYFAANGGRLFKQSLASGSATPITPAFGHLAAPRISSDGQWVVFVHTYERTDGLALVDTDGKHWPRKLAFGTDFVMQPAWHPDGHSIAYIAWNHPLMPWDGTELRLIHLDTDATGVPYAAEVQTLAGDDDTAIFQPEFSPDGRYLAYVSDATGLGQLYVYDLDQGTHTQLTDTESDHGAPAWVQGIRVYGWSHDSRHIYFKVNTQGFHSLWRFDVQHGTARQIEALTHYTYFNQIAVCPTRDEIAVVASATTVPERVIIFDDEDQFDAPRIAPPDPDVPPSITVIVDQPSAERIARRASAESVAPEELSSAQAITWKGHDGETVYGLYYPPFSTRFEGAGAPPLIVQIHGGPTSQVAAQYNAAAQFYATRGFAYLNVNYRGSTGYGRAYMEKLRGNWGLYDVEDAASGALHLVEQGLADRDRLVILGGSAGGFTVLLSLIEKPGFYRAGVCAYGVANQFLLAKETHKFEERYTDSLLGPLPEASALYRERSPYFRADQIVDPIIVFQGEEDVVVPRNQSDSMVESLRARGVPHEYHVYAGEGHGWRKPETIEHYYTHIIDFLTQYVIYA